MFVKTLLALSLCAPLSFLSGCQSAGTAPGGDPKAREQLVSLSVADRAVIRTDNGFGFRLFSYLASEKEAGGLSGGGNLFVSPLSVSMLLTMVYNGARGTTESGMADVLGYGGMDRAGVNALYAKLIPALTAADAKVTFLVANSLWSKTGFTAAPAFLDLNRDTFDAETRTQDFSSPGAVPAINGWVSDKTQGLIPEIVTAPLDPALVMILLNALYFKGDWTRPFDPAKTYDGDFHLSNGTLKKCRMMTGDDSVLFFSDEKVRALELPYGDSLFSMVFLQPKDSADTWMTGLIGDLQGGAWDTWKDKFAVTEGPVRVPKFKLEYSNSLAEILTSMGMASAFSDTADFTGIAAGGNLHLSEVLHKTYVSVDEKGTVAAAVTKGGIAGAAWHQELIALDRPFVVLIREKTSGAVIFLGRIMDPTL